MKVQLFMAAFAIGLGLLGWGGAAQRLDLERKVRRRTISPPPMAELDPRLLRILTFGHRGAYDDFANIWILQTLASEVKENGENPQEIREAVGHVFKHLPKLESGYMFACLVLALQLAAPEGCEEISRLGLQAFPGSWRILMTQGFVYMDLIKDPAKASLFFYLASKASHAPPYVERLARKMRDKEAVSAEDRAELDAMMREIPGFAEAREFMGSGEE